MNGAKTACSTYEWATAGSTSCNGASTNYQYDSTMKTKGTKCGAGFYSDSSTNWACTVCPAGYSCPESDDGTGRWPKFYCNSVSRNSYYSYCPTGSSYYYDTLIACPAWYNCNPTSGTGTAPYTATAICSDGKYFDGSNCVNCPAGSICRLRY